MSKIHEVKCDVCRARVPLTYNGEHWLTPMGWRELYDDNLAETTGQHLCPKCPPKPKKLGDADE